MIIIYKEMFLGCDWLIRVQLIPNITQNSAKICHTVQKSVTTVQKSVTTVQKSVISSLSDGIYSLKNQKYGGRIFTFAGRFRRNFNTTWDSSLTIMITKQTLKYAGTLYIKRLAMAFVNMNFLSEEIRE